MTSIDLTTEDGMLAYLKQTHFPQCSRVEQLTGGWSGYVYRAATGDAESPSVVVKHAERYAARLRSWKLDQNRMDFEATAMKYLSRPEKQSDPAIRIPKVLHYDRDKYVLVMEDAGPLPSLKTWTTQGVDMATCKQIGEAVGRFLARVHDATAGDQEVLAEFNGNETAKYLSGKLYFGGLPKAAEKVGYAEDFIAEAAKAGEDEVMQRSDVLTIGDFWTGNILVSAPSAQQRDLHLYVLDLELSKPGTAEFDIGQMAAEIWCLATFRKNVRDQSLALLEAFLSSYKATRSVAVDAAKVAIRIGAHLLVMMPMAWSGESAEEEIEAAAAEGREFVRMGWEKDVKALRQSVLAPLL